MLNISFLPNASRVFGNVPKIFRRHKLITTWMRFTGEHSVQLVRIRDDAFGYADMDEGFLRLILINGFFERDFFRIADKLLFSGGHFFDVGANYGLMSFGLANKFQDKIIAHLFEPNPKLWVAIENSASLYTNCKIILNRCAISDRSGEVALDVNEEHTGASHISIEGSIKVVCRKLDQYIEENNISEVALMKIDVEGYELVALKGCIYSLKKKLIKAIYFEYCGKWLSRIHPPGELIEFLENLGYEVFFCREHDFRKYGRATHIYYPSRNSVGLHVRPIAGAILPDATDLLALPCGSVKLLTAGERIVK